MDWFKCLFCLGALKDSELVCAASCDHYIHEWCVPTMKSIEDRRCKICDRNTVVHSVFKEFDLERSVQVVGVPIMIKKLEEVIDLIKSREGRASELQKNFEKISERLERLHIENRALKLEKNETEKRLKMLESEKNITQDVTFD